MTRGTLWSDAENSVTMPTPTIASAAPMRKLSMRRASSCQSWPKMATKRFTAEPLIAFVVGRARRFYLRSGGRAAEQIVVKHGARNGRGGLRAEAAVLDEHRERDMRMVCRRVGEIPRVIAQALIDVAGLVLVALERIQLRSAGLARGHVLRADESARAGSFPR